MEFASILMIMIYCEVQVNHVVNFQPKPSPVASDRDRLFAFRRRVAASSAYNFISARILEQICKPSQASPETSRGLGQGSMPRLCTCPNPLEI